jgi:hypothetical protein
MKNWLNPKAGWACMLLGTVLATAPLHAQEDAVLTVGTETVSISDFEHIFLKNNRACFRIEVESKWTTCHCRCSNTIRRWSTTTPSPSSCITPFCTSIRPEGTGYWGCLCGLQSDQQSWY